MRDGTDGPGAKDTQTPWNCPAERKAGLDLPILLVLLEVPFRATHCVEPLTLWPEVCGSWCKSRLRVAPVPGVSPPPGYPQGPVLLLGFGALRLPLLWVSLVKGLSALSMFL